MLGNGHTKYDMKFFSAFILTLCQVCLTIVDILMKRKYFLCEDTEILLVLYMASERLIFNFFFCTELVPLLM